MTSLSTSPLAVALMQTAASLPTFLLALPAGALADVVDRRRMLIFAQVWLLLAAAMLAVLTLLGLMTPAGLLSLTFILGIGSALSMPPWQASIPELVPRSELAAAVALGGVSLNTARAIGPALGGAIVAAWGPGAVFAVNAVSFLAVLIVLIRWRRIPTENALPAERFLGAVRAGLRYVRYAPAFRAVLVRTLVFIAAASALWALLPVVARREMGLGAAGYGALLGSLGLGAVTGSVFLPRLRKRLSFDALMVTTTVFLALLVTVLAHARLFALVCLAMFLAGVNWICLMATLNVAAQLAVPEWVRARALSVYLLAFMGGMAGGSIIWGSLAGSLGTRAALTIAAASMVAGLALVPCYRLHGRVDIDLAPSRHWPAPMLATEMQPDDGPVLVTVEYRVASSSRQDFLAAVHELSQTRRRDGAFEWAIFGDTADPMRYVEVFLVESWAEHLRQHDRFTVTDLELERRVHQFHAGDGPPKVSHLLYSRRSNM